MTFQDFAAYSMAMMAIGITISAIIAIIELRHLVQRNAGSYHRGFSSKIRLPSPGVYRLYSDGKHDVRRRYRYTLFALATLVLMAYWCSMGLFSGALLLNRFMVSNIWTQMAELPVETTGVVFSVLLFGFLLLHLICAPEAGYLKFLRTAIPFFAFAHFIAGIGLSIAFEGLILRFTYRACRIFAETAVCSAIY